MARPKNVINDRLHTYLLILLIDYNLLFASIN